MRIRMHTKTWTVRVSEDKYLVVRGEKNSDYTTVRYRSWFMWGCSCTYCTVLGSQTHRGGGRGSSIVIRPMPSVLRPYGSLVLRPIDPTAVSYRAVPEIILGGAGTFFVLWGEGVLFTTCPRGRGVGGNLSWGSRHIWSIVGRVNYSTYVSWGSGGSIWLHVCPGGGGVWQKKCPPG